MAPIVDAESDLTASSKDVVEAIQQRPGSQPFEHHAGVAGGRVGDGRVVCHGGLVHEHQRLVADAVELAQRVEGFAVARVGLLGVPVESGDAGFEPLADGGHPAAVDLGADDALARLARGRRIPLPQGSMADQGVADRAR